MSTPNFETLRIKSEHNFATVILSNPPVNALSKQLISDLNGVCDWIQRQENIRVVVFNGEGKHFCAGADLKERKSMSNEEVEKFVKDISDTFQKIAEISIPTLAAINGTCLGGGLELALACDFRIMADQGFIGFKETSLGIIPGGGGTQRLPRIIGVSLAKHWIFSAQSFIPEEALDDGVIDWLVDIGDLSITVNDICRLIGSNAPLALIAAKRAINEGLDLPVKMGLAVEQKAYKTIINTEDRKEALQAFFEKRSPEWKGN